MPQPSSKISRNLIVALKNGNIKAFDRLYEQYSERLFYFAKAILKNIEDAEEVVQEVFIRVWQNRNKIDEYSSFRSYLFTIAYNLIVDCYRNRLKEKKFKEFLEANVKDVDSVTEKDVEFHELNEMLKKAVEQLPPRRKQIYKMNRENGLTYEEIAVHLKISPHTVKNQMSQALKFLKNKVNKETLVGLLFFYLFI